MGISISLLSASTSGLLCAGCFAWGYLHALNYLRSTSAASDGSDDDDKNKKKKRGSLRLLSWAQTILSRTEASNKGDALAVDVSPAKRKKPSSLLEIESLAEILVDFKMVLVVRSDLKMGKGKIAAQCSHATLGLYKKLLYRAPKSLNRWEMCGQVKVVLKIESEEELLVLQERAKSLKLPTHITVDAGRTQIAPNSRTVMAILGLAKVGNITEANALFEKFRANGGTLDAVSFNALIEGNSSANRAMDAYRIFEKTWLKGCKIYAKTCIILLDASQSRVPSAGCSCWSRLDRDGKVPTRC